MMTMIESLANNALQRTNGYRGRAVLAMNGVLGGAERAVPGVVLHQFVKKTDKTPPKEIDVARRRMKDVT